MLVDDDDLAGNDSEVIGDRRNPVVGGVRIQENLLELR